MTAKRPARLVKTRHGTFCLRLIVPVKFRTPDAGPREVRVSLRTRDPVHARILALEFNLALERRRAMTPDIDPRHLVAPWSLEIDSLKVEVKDHEDMRSFNAFLDANPGVRDAITDAIRRGSSPEKAMEAARAIAAQSAPSTSAWAHRHGMSLGAHNF